MTMTANTVKLKAFMPMIKKNKFSLISNFFPWPQLHKGRVYLALREKLVGIQKDLCMADAIAKKTTLSQ